MLGAGPPFRSADRTDVVDAAAPWSRRRIRMESRSAIPIDAHINEGRSTMSASHPFKCRVTATAVVACLTLAFSSRSHAQTVLFADDFDAGTSGMHWVTFDTGDATAHFAYDYSAYGIPPAPRATGGASPFAPTEKMISLMKG